MITKEKYMTQKTDEDKNKKKEQSQEAANRFSS